MTDAAIPAQWPKPGPGTWELDASHSGAAPGPILRNLYERCLVAGMTEGFALFGAPLKTMEMHWVNGRFYRRLVPLIGGSVDRPPPPAPILWLASRLHPAFRRAERRARESFEVKRWRSEIDRWEREWKPSIIKTNVTFSDVDPAMLDSDGLAEHLSALHAHLLETVPLHFRLHVSDMGPLGNLMIHLEDWGLARSDTFRALVAASPATRDPSDQLRQVADTIRQAGVDPATLTALDEVRVASPDASKQLDQYLRVHGWRLTTGYDLEDRALIELPTAIVASIRAAATTEPLVDHHAAAAEALQRLRDDVPAEHRDEFDELAEDARLSYGLRDENGPITYEWPAGLLRRALLECGRRLATTGRVEREADVFELDVDEIRALLRDGATPSLTEISRRRAERALWAALDPPERIGPVEAPPPVDVLPPNLAKITRIVLAVVSALEADADRAPLEGMGIGESAYVGTARVVRDASEALASVEPGDVIVAPYTAPTYNAVLAIAGAIVTEEGGLLCHAAVLARELRLPAVIGASEAMSRIPDGATIEVDPIAGRVRVIAGQPVATA